MTFILLIYDDLRLPSSAPSSVPQHPVVINLVPCCTKVTGQGGADREDEKNDSRGVLPYVALLQTTQARLLPTVSTVVAGGEPCSRRLVNQLLCDIPAVPQVRESVHFRQSGYIK